MNGTDLLDEFRRNRTEAAFSALVHRYTNLVFSVAKRRLNNVSHAEEAAQAVFIKLAKSVPNVRNDAELMAWLHRTTINASIDLWRTESRRRTREEHAAVMQPDSTENARWEEIAPIVDEALNELNDADRQAVLLRFFQRRSMREVGAEFGVSEDAAKMRVSRALEHLRAACGRKGVTCGAGVLAAVLTEHAVETASAGLLLTLTTLQISTTPSVGTTAGVFVSALKTKLVIGAVAVAGTAAIVWLASKNSGNGIQTAGQTEAASNHTAPTSAAAAPATAGLSANAEVTPPDPIKLLRAVARARSKIRSGELEFEVANDDLDRPSLSETNYVRLKARFDGINRRFESFAREYSYTAEANDDTNVQAQVNRMTHEQAVEAGLLKPFDSHHLIAYDGTKLMDYWETDGPPMAHIQDPARGTGSYIFDPRCLGISIVLSVNDTIDACLANEQVQYVGEEFIEGVFAWRVRNSIGREFWIEKSNPTRVLKLASSGNYLNAKYDPANLEDPIPIEVTTFLLQRANDGQTSFFKRRITRRNARFNVPVDPTSWTLAGLEMKIGTSIGDDRLRRMLGYWNGSGYSDNLPADTAKPQPAPDRAKLMAYLQNEPYLPEALDAAQWIISNTPDGPEVEEAAQVILEDHIDNTNLAYLCRGLERLRPRCATNILEALLERNPSIGVRGNACLALATLRKADAKYGADQKATAEAVSLFERTIADFGQVKKNGVALAELAKPELDELRRLIVGKPAPPIQGADLDGRIVKWSDYRGQVVVLNFWGECGGCRPQVPALLKWLDQLNGKPVAILGVFCDDDAAKGKSIADESGMVWPSIRDNRTGPVSTTWNNNEWPVFDVIDAKGIIRYRNLVQNEVPAAVEALLQE